MAVSRGRKYLGHVRGKVERDVGELCWMEGEE